MPEVVVRVLGPVDVLGAERPFARAWTLDLVAYLALHPGGVRADEWETALWPDRLLAPATRHSTVSAARRALGRSEDASPRLVRAGGRLGLGPTVTTDWARFCALADASGPAAPEAWGAALELVRGRPFEGLRAADWTVLEGIEAMVEDAVVQLAVRLADRLLATHDARGAELALRRSLRASPYDERLYRLLLVAADRQGNPAGVESAMTELLHLLGALGPAGARTPAGGLDGRALEAVHPETAALYRALSRRRCAGAVAARRPGA